MRNDLSVDEYFKEAPFICKYIIVIMISLVKMCEARHM